MVSPDNGFPSCIVFWMGKSNHNLQKIFDDGLSKTLVRALPYWTVQLGKPSPVLVVSGVVNCRASWGPSVGYILYPLLGFALIDVLFP